MPGLFVSVATGGVTVYHEILICVSPGAWIMRKSLIFIVLLLAMSGSRLALAEMAVLVHGYATDLSTWDRSGVTAVLESAGWKRGGVLLPGPAGYSLHGPPAEGAARRFYLVALPATAPLAIQAGQLASALAVLRDRYPDEPLILTGHSAGGVVARLVVLGGNPWRISKLVTIASPHLGTVRAAQGLEVADGKPFFCPGPGIDFMKHLVGGENYDYLEASRGVLFDLLPPAPGNFMEWLARQEHPKIAYVAVVREGPFWIGDELVPAWSQDLGNVPSLKGRVEVVRSLSSHGLTPADGRLLAELL